MREAHILARAGRIARSVLSLNRGQEYRRLVRLLDLQPADVVLDIGSGDGFWTARLARERRSVCGLEPDDGLLGYARRFYRSPGVKYVQSVAETIPFRDHSFDKVISISCLEHFADPVAALREMHRVLRPGGRLAISVDSLLSENSGPEFREWHRSRHFVNNYFDQDSLLDALRSVGFHAEPSVAHIFRSAAAARLRERFIRNPKRWLPLFPLFYGGVRLADFARNDHHGQIIVLAASKVR